MGWRELLGDLLMKAGDSLPTPPRPVITDPLNYALDCTLRKSYPAPADLFAEVRAAFPMFAQAEYDSMSQELAKAQHLATDLASGVNKHQLTEDEARQRLGQAFPQISKANLSRLIMQNLIGTR